MGGHPFLDLDRRLSFHSVVAPRRMRTRAHIRARNNLQNQYLQTRRETGMTGRCEQVAPIAIARAATGLTHAETYVHDKVSRVVIDETAYR